MQASFACAYNWARTWQHSSGEETVTLRVKGVGGAAPVPLAAPVPFAAGACEPAGPAPAAFPVMPWALPSAPSAPPCSAFICAMRSCISAERVEDAAA